MMEIDDDEVKIIYDSHEINRESCTSTTSTTSTSSSGSSLSSSSIQQMDYDSHKIKRESSTSTSSSSSSLSNQQQQQQMERDSRENQREFPTFISTSTSTSDIQMDQNSLCSHCCCRRRLLADNSSTDDDDDSNDDDDDDYDYSSDDDDDDDDEKKEDEICGICREEIPAERELLLPSVCPRKHIFHETCLARWVLYRNQEQLSVLCPICRSELIGWRSLLQLGNIFDYIKLREYVYKNKDNIPEPLREFLMDKIEKMYGHRNSAVSFIIEFLEKWPESDANNLGCRLGYVFDGFPNMKEEFNKFILSKHKCTRECGEKICFVRDWEKGENTHIVNKTSMTKQRMTACMKQFFSNDLTEEISNNILSIFMSANSYTSKRTVALRIIRYVVENVVNMEMEDIYELKNLFFLDLCTLKHIEYLWKEYAVKNCNSNENQFMEKILSKDYHKHSDIVKLANLFERRVADIMGRKKVNALFAIDGFNGPDYKNYVSHLGNSNAYCKAIRKLYEFVDFKSEIVHSTITKILEIKSGDDDDDKQKDDDNDENSEYVDLFRRWIGNDYEKVLTAQRKEIEKINKLNAHIIEVNSNNNKKRKNDEDGGD